MSVVVSSPSLPVQAPELSAAGRDMRFHELADVLPLIEGIPFDELVESIKRNGQRDTIITLNGTILDGRNRYRACLAAGVEPRFEELKPGTDPIAFVIDCNLHRRNLTEGQRSIAMARYATYPRGRPESQQSGDANVEPIDIASKSLNGSTDPFNYTIDEAAKMANVGSASIKRAKVILAEGTEEEKQAVQSGIVGLAALAEKIRSRRPTDTKSSPQQRRDLTEAGKNPKRIENIRLRKSLWNHLREAFDHIGNLPLPADVVKEMHAFGQAARISERLPRALRWMEEFSHEWNEFKTGARKGNVDARNGASDVGTQHDQPSDQRPACPSDRPPDQA